VALIDAMEKVRATLTQDVHALFGYGVALHRGSALIGNKGSKQRLDYGVVGDLINAAARVESLTKYYGVRFIVTREVVGELIAPHESRLIDRVIVKGKSVPLELLEVRHNLSGENFTEVARVYGEAFILYQRGEFAEAERCFTALSAIDGASKVLARRCAQFVVNPPQEWNGIFTLEAK
jgi:adenylate cyclase